MFKDNLLIYLLLRVIQVTMRSKGGGLQPLVCSDCVFESRRGHGCLPLVFFVIGERSLRCADPSSREVLPGACACV